MTAGDPAGWDDLFANNLVPSVLELVLEAWATIDKPVGDEHEDATTVRLHCAMLKGKDRSRHAFLIRIQDVEVDTSLGKVTGRKDIAFFPATEEDIYFCLEAKRLNVVVNGVRKALADEYVKNGMQRFVDGKYGGRVRHGGMLGYVLDGDVARAMTNVSNNIDANRVALCMAQSGTWRRSSSRPTDTHARESVHYCLREPAGFLIHHVFVTK